MGNTRIKSQNEKFSALLYIRSVNGIHPNEAQKRPRFEDLTPVFPNERIHLETPGTEYYAYGRFDITHRQGAKGYDCIQPKTGKTTLLADSKSHNKKSPGNEAYYTLIDERPEEVTDIKESIEGKNGKLFILHLMSFLKP